MNTLSLRTKIILIGGLPFLMFLAAIGYQILSNLRAYQHASLTANNATLAISTSALIHELQKERGKSVTFLKGGLAASELQSQRDLTNKALEQMTRLQAGRQSQPSGLTELRVAIDSKSKSVPEVLISYTRIIEASLEQEVTLARLAKGTKAEGKMSSIIVLEMAKENAGRLRANLAGVLTANAPITDEQLGAIMAASGGIEANLNSKTLDLSAAVREKIANFQKSDGWKDVSVILKHVLRNADRGMYNRDPKEFFKTISSSIDQLAVVVRDATEEAKELAEQEKIENKQACVKMSVLGTSLAAALIFMVIMSIRSITKPVMKVVSDLNQASNQISNSTTSLRTASESISSSVTESAAALQETSAAITEITSMITKNAENADGARELSEEGRDRVLSGKQMMEEMTAAISEIKSGQDEVTREMEESNSKIASIVQLIMDIKQKTKVIDEIVFQTKLLSFNASVEAARAGENGKGFAVVAEEVGSLAQLSGRAAKEISEMLDRSASEVEKTVAESTKRMKVLMEQSSATVSRGISVAENCFSALENLVGSVSEVSLRVSEISGACKEQATGVNEISTAVTQLNTATQQNANSSTESAQAATELSKEVERLNEVIVALNQVIYAQAAAKNGSPHQAHKDPPESSHSGFEDAV